MSFSNSGTVVKKRKTKTLYLYLTPETYKWVRRQALIVKETSMSEYVEQILSKARKGEKPQLSESVGA